MKYVNLGCGNSYIESKEWTNFDFFSNTKSVIATNLLSGIPLESNSVDVVYHSNILEHFLPKDGEKFLKECFRVLMPNGILRIAIPDLEQIALEYIKNLNIVLSDDSEKNRKNYYWIVLELIDQIARNYSGGEMLHYWKQERIVNEDYLKERIGYEFTDWRNNETTKQRNNETTKQRNSLFVLTKKIVKKILSLFIRIGKESEFEKIGKFRMSGEVHQWMYDKYSIKKLLQEIGFSNIEQKDAYSSSISNWENFSCLDVRNGEIRKPDSIFFEAKK